MLNRLLPVSRKSAPGTDTAHARKACDFQTLVSLIVKIDGGDDWASSTSIAMAIAVYGIDRFRLDYMSWVRSLELTAYAAMTSDEEPDRYLYRQVCLVSSLDGSLSMMDNHGYSNPVSCFASDRLFALAVALWPSRKMHNVQYFAREFDAIEHLKRSES